MKLKTLKDLIVVCDICKKYPENNCHHPCCKNNKRVKQEAIKWILESEGKKFYCMICEEFDCDCSSSDCFKIYHLEEVIKSKKHFFDITKGEI